MGSSTGGSVPRIMVFRPTLEEMKDFAGYINHMESQGAHKAGLAKIIPPKEWVPRKEGYDSIDLVIPAPIEQMVHGRQGLFQQFNIQKKSMKVEDFRKLAETSRYCTPAHFDYEDLERKYWKNISFNPPIYGADVSGSLYDEGVDEFNINHLNTVLDLVGEDYGIKIEGVNTAYLYFGMWKTTFAWHTEDMDLYSINYLHFGAPKSWYAVPPEHGRRLERLAAGFFQPSFQTCAAFLRHKMTVISPPILKKYSIPFNKITQEPGEFMITFPFGYHAGFNHGFNCAESTNFASVRWVEYGKRSSQCICRKDGVKIGMDIFMRKFQPDRYDLWLNGKDVGPHPEDPSRCSAANPPSKAELSFYKMEGKRQYKTDPLQTVGCSTVSKRHPISKAECSSSEESSSSSSSSCESSDSSDSSDTEVYDVQEPTAKTDIDSKHKRNSSHLESTERTKPLKIVCKKMTSDMLQDVKKKRYKKKKDGPPHLKPFFNRDNQTAKHSKKECDPNNSYSSLVSQEGPLRLIISKQSKDGPSIPYKSKTDGSLIPASLLPLQHAAMAKCESTLNTGAQIKYPKQSANCSPPIAALEQFTSSHWAPVALLQSNNFDSKPSATDLRNPNSMYYPVSGAATSSNIHQPVSVSKYINCAVKVENADANQSGGQSLDFSMSSKPPPQTVITHGAAMKAVSTLARNNENISNHQVPSTLYQFDSQDHYLAMPLLSDELIGDDLKLESNYQMEALPSLEGETCLLRPMESISPHGTSRQQFSHLNQPNSISHSNADIFSDIAKTKSQSSMNQSIDSDSSDNTITSTSSVEVKISKCVQLPKTPIWAKHLADLWQHLPSNFEKEVAFNRNQSMISPHCSICSVFRPLCEKRDGKRDINIPAQSRVLMPVSVFSEKSSSFKNILDMNSTEICCDGLSTLLQCSQCQVCVHAVCYGVSQHVSSESWVCDRCSSQAKSAKCCACSLRGGALKQTLDVNAKWAHIICAVLIKEVYFKTIDNKEKIDMSKVLKKRRKLTCIYCKKLFSGTNDNPGDGLCIQCTAGKCYRAFHVTCGHAAGVRFEAKDWPTQLSITCTRHPGVVPKKSAKRQLRKVSLGDRVFAKYSNGRFYKCDVTKVESRTYISADFEDGSYSENLFPEDIVERDGSSINPLQVGEFVRIKWTDNKIYSATFKGERTVVTYTIEYDDGSEKQLQREEFYSVDEELPKKVRSKLST